MTDGVDAPGPTQEREWGALVLVIGVWAVITIGLFVVAVRTASPIPWIDDWDLVRPLTGDRPIGQWLWEPYINHSVPLPRMLLLGIYKFNHGDFRAAPYVNVAVLSALALFMILAAGRIRGRVEFTDAIFPMALLSIDREILFATLGVNLIPSTVLSCLVLILILNAPNHPPRRTIILAGLLTLALAMCGSSGAAQVPPLTLWLAYVGYRNWRGNEPSARQVAYLAWGLALGILVYLWVSVPKPEDRPDHPGWKAALRTSFEFLSTAVGPAAMTLNNSMFGPRPWLGVIIALLVLATGILLVISWIRSPIERMRAAGLFLLLVGMSLFALGVGWGRADRVPGAGYATRYAVYTSPLLFAVYFAWGIYGRRIWSRLVPFALFAMLCVVFAPNVGQSFEYVRNHVRTTRSIERDLLAGSPPSLLAERYATFMLTGDTFRDHLTMCMRLLHRDGIGIFRQIQDPETATVRIPVQPVRVSQVNWKDGVAECTGDDAFLIFSLKEPTFVYGIRVRGRYEKAGEDVQFQIYWRNDRQDYTDNERTLATTLSDLSKEQGVMALVNDRIDHFRIDPAHKPCRFRIDSIELIVPARDKSEP